MVKWKPIVRKNNNQMTDLKYSGESTVIRMPFDWKCQDNTQSIIIVFVVYFNKNPPNIKTSKQAGT